MKTKNVSTTVQTQNPVVIQRTFHVPAAKVWEAWSSAEQVKQWWGPKNYSCPHCEIDFRIGGKYLASMRGEDGREIWSTGIYKEVIPTSKIVLTDSFSDEKGQVIPASEIGMPGEWPDELLITVELDEDNGNTTMKLTHAGIPAEAREDCVQGWEETMDKLEKFLHAKGRTTM